MGTKPMDHQYWEYRRELDINDAKYQDEVDKKLLITPKQFERRVKLSPDHPDYVQILSDADEYYAFYMSYLKKGQRVYVKLGLRPFELGAITDIFEFMVAQGRFEYQGHFEKFEYRGKPVLALPQTYVTDDKAAESNRGKNRFTLFGHYTGTLAIQMFN